MVEQSWLVVPAELLDHHQRFCQMILSRVRPALKTLVRLVLTFWQREKKMLFCCLSLFFACSVSMGESPA